MINSSARNIISNCRRRHGHRETAYAALVAGCSTLLDSVFTSSAKRPSRHRARLAVTAAAATLALAGGTVAAAAVGPHLWNEAFGPTAPATARYQPDPSTAHRVLDIPGPRGQRFAAWTIANRVGWRCIATFFQPAATVLGRFIAIDQFGCDMPRGC